MTGLNFFSFRDSPSPLLAASCWTSKEDQFSSFFLIFCLPNLDTALRTIHNNRLAKEEEKEKVLLSYLDGERGGGSRRGGEGDIPDWQARERGERTERSKSAITVFSLSLFFPNRVFGCMRREQVFPPSSLPPKDLLSSLFLRHRSFSLFFFKAWLIFICYTAQSVPPGGRERNDKTGPTGSSGGKRTAALISRG